MNQTDLRTMYRCAEPDHLIEGKWFFCSVVGLHPSTAARFVRCGWLERRYTPGANCGVYSLTEAGRRALAHHVAPTPPTVNSGDGTK